MFLEGDRVRLRPADLDDAPRLAGWINDPGIAHYLGGPARQFSLAAERAFVASKSANDGEHGLFLVIEATDGPAPVAIGTIELRRLEPVARRGEVGMLIGERDYWSRGFGSDALRTLCRFGFAELDLHRIELTVASYNPRAQRAYAKVGFVEEGRLREHRYAAGRYYDTLVMGLLREGFEAREAARAERGAP
jgi:RimJ/RimL family protein N-acetyltransferase